MLKLIAVAWLTLNFISLSGRLKAADDAPQVKAKSPTSVAATPKSRPDWLLASATLPLDPSQQPVPTPTPISTVTLEPLKSRVVKHQPDQFRTDAISTAELSAIKRAIEAIRWSRNSNPQAAAKEDYAAIKRECTKSGMGALLQDLLTEALSNDYKPNDGAANDAYSSELNSEFENGDQSVSSTGKGTGSAAAGQAGSVEKSGLTPTAGQPDGQANAAARSPAQQPVSGEVRQSKIGRAKHRLTVRPKIVDVKMRLLALWHQSLAPTGKSPK